MEFTKTDLYYEGYSVGFNDLDEKNPYNVGSTEYEEWLEGFCEGYSES